MMFIYNILFTIAFVAYLPVLLVRGKLHTGFKERFGFLTPEQRYRLGQKPNIWFHAVSVGEILAIVPLVNRLRDRFPDKQIVISTVTTTGYELAQKRFTKTEVILFAPIDFRFSVNRFVAAIKPEIFIAAETELWPNLLTALARRDVPLVMINGRISDSSYRNYRRFRFLFARLLRPFRLLCMQGSRDADRIIALGASAQHVVVVGSMKFDDVATGEEMALARFGFKAESLVWVAGSTHPGEEKIIVQLFKKLKKEFPELSLILAPRHIHRGTEVCDLVKAEGFKVARFSQLLLPQAPDENEVVVLDTIGHLKAMYNLAVFVFVGKSLVGQGGQNIIEPAFFGKPVIVGPNMQNFQDITDIFLEARCLLQVQDSVELESAVRRLLQSSALRKTLGDKAQSTIQKNQGATLSTEKHLARIISAKQFIKPV